MTPLGPYRDPEETEFDVWVRHAKQREADEAETERWEREQRELRAMGEKEKR